MMRKALNLVGIMILIATVSVVGIASAYPNNDISDVYSEPNGYAEAVVMGSWTRFGHPYYSVLHYAYTHTGGWGSARFIGWSKTGAVLYDITVQFSGSVSYNPGLYNTIWAAETICSISGETAIADIGPPGSA
jgi:hypothetical protein